MTFTLTATTREATGKAARGLLTQGIMPAVVYGPKMPAETISIPLADFQKLLRDEGESTVVEIAGLGKNIQALVQDIYRDPVTHLPHHADFYAIEKGAKVEVAVPLSFVGESPAVKLGASLVKVMHELPVEADPSKLPHELEVDLAALEAIGDQIHVKDIKLPAGVVATADGEEVVAIAQEPAPEEPTETAAPDMESIEVEKKGKDEEEAA
jgi:large subunit ribosomal protein L25